MDVLDPSWWILRGKVVTCSLDNGSLFPLWIMHWPIFRTDLSSLIISVFLLDRYDRKFMLTLREYLGWRLDVETYKLLASLLLPSVESATSADQALHIALIARMNRLTRCWYCFTTIKKCVVVTVAVSLTHASDEVLSGKVVWPLTLSFSEGKWVLTAVELNRDAKVVQWQVVFCMTSEQAWEILYPCNYVLGTLCYIVSGFGSCEFILSSMEEIRARAHEAL